MKTRRPPCLEWREKLALRHEDLSPDDQQALDAHVATCETCTAALADYHFFEARLDALPPPAIKPLPRLSPHFFEQIENPRGAHAKKEKSDALRSTRGQPARKHGKITFVGRLLSVAAVICLLLASVLLFRTVYLARLAEHPGGITLLNLNQHTAAVMAVAWSPDGKYIATASLDNTVKVWNAQTGTLVCNYVEHSAEVYALAWSPNGKFIASGSGDDTVRIWDPLYCDDTSYPIHTETDPVMSVAWSPDGREIASGGWDHTIQIWNAMTGKTLWTKPTSDVVSSIAWAPNSEIAVGNYDTSVSFWSASGEFLQSFTPSSDAAVNTVAWSPQNPNLLAVGTQDGTVGIWNAHDLAPIWTCPSHLQAVFGVAWSPSGTYLALGGDDNIVQVWNPFTQKMLATYVGHTNTISSLAWSPNGKEIVSGSFDSTAKVWKVVN